MNSLIKAVEEHYEDYEPTKAARAIQDFVINKLSNWYIRLNRRRFWKGSLIRTKKMRILLFLSVLKKYH